MSFFYFFSFSLPLNTVAPVISGNQYFGEMLTVSNGTWNNGPTSYAYQWKRDGVNISGATNNTYTVGSSDFLTTITCTVTAINASGSESVNSSNSKSIEIYDDFTNNNDTGLSLHTGRGLGWRFLANHTSAEEAKVYNNKLVSRTSSDIYRIDVQTNTANYEVEADFIASSNLLSTDNIGIILRASGGNTSADRTYYYVRWSGTANTFGIFKAVNNVITGFVNGSYSTTFTAGETKNVRLRIIGNVMTVYINNTLVFTITDTDTPITDKGYAGYRGGSVQTSTTGVHIDNFNVRDIV